MILQKNVIRKLFPTLGKTYGSQVITTITLYHPTSSAQQAPDTQMTKK